jgi:hypothetical protein
MQKTSAEQVPRITGFPGNFGVYSGLTHVVRYGTQ